MFCYDLRYVFLYFHPEYCLLFADLDPGVPDFEAGFLRVDFFPPAEYAGGLDLYAYIGGVFEGVEYAADAGLQEYLLADIEFVE